MSILLAESTRKAAAIFVRQACAGANTLQNHNAEPPPILYPRNGRQFTALVKAITTPATKALRLAAKTLRSNQMMPGQHLDQRLCQSLPPPHQCSLRLNNAHNLGYHTLRGTARHYVNARSHGNRPINVVRDHQSRE